MNEKFAAYGVGLEIPDDWRIEFNPKNNRDRGDFAFHSQKNNVFFVSWGKLEKAERNFKTLEHYRDESVKRIRRNPNVKRADVETTSKRVVSGHDAILSKVVAQRRRGFMSRSEEPSHEIWTVHFYCPESSRYYVAYWDIRDGSEYPQTETMFTAIVDSLTCHR